MGGTEIYRPLESIFRDEVDEQFPRIIFLITDGDIDNPERVIELIEKNNWHTRVHSFGIGSGVSTHLVRQSAMAGKGKAYFIQDGEII